MADKRTQARTKINRQAGTKPAAQQSKGSRQAVPNTNTQDDAHANMQVEADVNAQDHSQASAAEWDWRPGVTKAVKQYVNLMNEAELKGSTEVLNRLIGDEDHLTRLQARLSRIADRERFRDARAVRHESKARIVNVRQEGEGCLVTLERDICRSFGQGGAKYTEERKELDRLWIAPTGRRSDAEWRITKVEPFIPERAPRLQQQDERIQLYEHAEQAAHGAFTAAEGLSGQRPASLPFINYELMPHFFHRRFGTPYQRDMAAAYADRYWNEPNPEYEYFDVNCTNYVSQCLFAGHAPMNYTGRRENGWWYRGRSGSQELWSYSWAVSNALAVHLSSPRSEGLRATVVQSAEQLRIGDVIAYDWDGNGRFQHTTIVTAFDRNGMPLVNSNTVSSRHRYWDYRDSYAWTERTIYRMFHIADEL